MAEAMRWVSHISTVCGIMVAPAVLGIWIDNKAGTTGLFAILGLLIGMPTSLWYLLKLVNTQEKK